MSHHNKVVGRMAAAAGAAVNGESAELRRSPDFEWDSVPITNRAQLCTYADCIGQHIGDLQRFLSRPELEGALYGLHLLPIFKSSVDRGFAPKNYREIEPKYGTWEQVEELAGRYEMVTDYMANHIGAMSEEFQDFVKHGKDSKYYDLFIHWESIFDGEEPTKMELGKFYLRKPKFPYLDVEHPDGSSSRLWNTFSEDQIDLNPRSDVGAAFTRKCIDDIAQHGPKMVRLDAVGYITKKRGTDCFFNRPEIYEHLDSLQEVAERHDLLLLAEVHEHYTFRLDLAARGFWVYDFCLPMMVLHALHTSNAATLRNWLSRCPFRQITVLDTHDGVGVPDVEDIMTSEQVEATERGMCGCSETVQWVYCPESGEFKSRDMTHQHNCTFYAALQGRDSWYLLARAIQMFTPGVPMVYYVGLLAGLNDEALADATGSDRNLNRHYYSCGEAMDALKKPVVQELLKLLRFRNSYPAFNGDLIVDTGLAENRLRVKWAHGQALAVLDAHLESKEWSVTYRCLQSGSMKQLELSTERLEGQPTAACYS